MNRSAPVSWKLLASMAVGSVIIAAADPASRPAFAFIAAALGLGAIAAYGSARVAAHRPHAAIAWLGAGLVAAVMAWGLAEDYPFGYMLAAFQFLVGTALLPGHLRRSARQAAEGIQAGPSKH